MHWHYSFAHCMSRTGAPWPRLLALAVLVAAAPGCAIYDRTSSDVDRAVGAWQRPRVQLASPDGSGPAAEPRSRPATTAPAATGDRRLETCISDALERNPAIRAAVADVQAKLEHIPQAAALPDPILRTIVRPEPIQTAAGDLYFTLAIGQKIPLPAKLERAGRAAAAEVRMAIEQLNATRLRVIADVERAYYALYLTDRYIELTAANRALLEDLEQVVNAQYQVARVPQQDVLRVQTMVAELRDAENEYRLRRASVAAALNKIMDYPVAHPQPATELLDLETLALDVQQLIHLAEEHNPELAKLSNQAQRDRERVKLADLGYWPDLTVGFEWSHLERREAFRPPPNPQTGIVPPYNRASQQGDDNWAITAQLNLPIWSQRIEAAKREARRNLLKTQHETHSARNLIAFRIYDAWTRVETQQQTVHLLQSTLIPQAQQTYEVTLTAYQAGQTDFLSVIDSWRRWLDFELMLHRETVDLETAFSELQREVGLRLVRASYLPNDSANEE